MYFYRVATGTGHGCYSASVCQTNWQLGDHDTKAGRPCPDMDVPEVFMSPSQYCAFASLEHLCNWFWDIRELQNLYNYNCKVWIIKLSDPVYMQKQVVGYNPQYIECIQLDTILEIHREYDPLIRRRFYD